MKQFLSIIAIVTSIVSLVVISFTLWQVEARRASLESDLQLRTALLADSFKESIRPAYLNNATTTVQKVLDKFAGRERLLGLAVYDNKGFVFATSTGLSRELVKDADLAEKAMDSDSALSDSADFNRRNVYTFVTPLHEDENVVGALMVFQKADYISDEIRQIWETNIIRLLTQALLLSLAIALFLNWAIYKPILNITETVRQVRSGSQKGDIEIRKGHIFLKPIVAEMAKMSMSLISARNTASEEARMRLEKLDSPWTAERLKEFFKAYSKDRQIFVVSNREPYVHKKSKNDIYWEIPASGLITALEPVMEACGGMWLAHGSGSADRQTVDSENKIKVPPDEPKYTLKRIWLSEKERREYYDGFSNEALWPLCHLVHTRPIFRKSDWLAYRQVNGKFAQHLLKEIKKIQKPILFIQDYHFALLPAMIKKSRPDAEIGLFWHIPWPSTDIFSICPWRKEILNGMLGSDILGFHTQQYCNNFMDTVSKEIESIADLEKFAIIHSAHTTYVKPFPISVAFTGMNRGNIPAKPKVLDKMGVRTRLFGIGVDRLDYTKGIMERFKGLEFFFHLHPEFIEKFTFLQIADPSRESIEKYQQLNRDVTQEAERINKRFEKNGWKPIILLKEHYTHEKIYALFRSAQTCLVTPLHDGMNLVAKEYVAARNDEAGVLVISKFAGSSRELKDAIIINPYSAEDTADAIYQALTMPVSEQHRRMKKMRNHIRDYNVYRWAAEFLKSITSPG